jgi:pimeloyl-ACP methyl ester carboxylesterase
MAAELALLVMYAWDMCDANLDPGSLAVDPRINADGWDVVGIITGADDIVTSGPGGIRQSRISASSDNDRKRYGYLARNKNIPQQHVVVIRGTDGAEEWFDDFVFVMKAPAAPFTGRVDTGFFDIYQSLQYFPLNNPTAIVPLVQGIESAIGSAGTVKVLGHSLGAALATYLTFALADPLSLGSRRVSAVFFASPKTGDHDFVGAFAARVEDYLVINYDHDLVPQTPPFDITQFDLYRSLPVCMVITDKTANVAVSDDKACCHHLICYVAMLCSAVYQGARTAPGWTGDDGDCAACIT